MFGLSPLGATPLGSLWIDDLIGPIDPIRAFLNVQVEKIYLVEIIFLQYTNDQLTDTGTNDALTDTSFGTILEDEIAIGSDTSLNLSTHNIFPIRSVSYKYIADTLTDSLNNSLLTDIDGSSLENTGILVIDANGPQGSIDKPYFARIKNAYNFTTSMYDSAFLSGKSKNGAGDITILNPDGKLDNYLSMPWDNSEISILVGAKNVNFINIFNGKIESADWDRTYINLHLRDKQSVLDIPIQKTTYAGTGGLEGGQDLKGKPKPTVWGNCINIQPPLVDSANLIYQVHDGYIEDIYNVRFAGLIARKNIDYTVDLSNGTFKLLTNPLGVVTCDVKGSNFGSYVEDTSSIIKRILIRRGGFTEDDLDLISFNTVLARNTSTIGYYTGIENINISQIMDDLMTGIGGYFGVNRNSKFYIGILDVSSPVLYEYDINRITRVKRINTPLPSNKTNIGYQRLWYTMEASQIAGSVPSNEASFLQQTVRLSSYETEDTKINHPLSYIRDIRGYFYYKEDADRESIRQQNLFGKDQNYYEVDVVGLTFRENLGDIVSLPDYDRFGIGNNKFIITSITENSKQNLLTLVLWDNGTEITKETTSYDGEVSEITVIAEGAGIKNDTTDTYSDGSSVNISIAPSGSGSASEKPSSGSTVSISITAQGSGSGGSPPGYIRPYADNAAWNQIATEMPLHPHSATLVSLHYNSIINSASPFLGIRGFAPVDSDYTFPVYYTRNATGTYTINCINGNMNGRTIPWNPNWTPMPSSQTDNQFILLDDDLRFDGIHHVEWNAWKFSNIDTLNKIITCTTCNLIQSGTSSGWGSPADYYTKNNGYAPCRGVGIQQFAMLGMSDEVADGAISHAIAAPIMNPDSSTVEGVYPFNGDYGWVNPATKYEGHGGPNQIAEGIRFRGTWTDADIDAQLVIINNNVRNNGGSQATSTALQNLARIIMVALRDYGWIVSDTSGANGIQLVGQKSHAAQWAALGIPVNTTYGSRRYPLQLLRDLITANNFVAVDGTAGYPSNH